MTRWRKHVPPCPLVTRREPSDDALFTTRWRIAVYNSRRLSFRAKAVAGALSSWMNNHHGFATVRGKRVALDAGCDERTFWRGVRELEDEGFLWRQSYAGQATEFHAEIPDDAFPTCVCGDAGHDTSDASLRHVSRIPATPVTHHVRARN